MLKNSQGLTEEDFLLQYDPGKYERPSVTVDMLIFTIINNKLNLLMVKRADHPSIGQWALPGGFVNMDENLDTAAARELKEETGLDNIYMEQVYTWGDVGRDPRTRIITTAYMALLDSSNLEVNAGDDAADAKWFSVECTLEKKENNNVADGIIMDHYYKLVLNSDKECVSATIKISKTIQGRRVEVNRTIVNSDNIAADHSKIIEQAIEVLKNKIKTTGIIFNLLPETFELNELRLVYEAICKEKVDCKNILEMFSNRIVETNGKEKYKYNHNL